MAQVRQGALEFQRQLSAVLRENRDLKVYSVSPFALEERRRFKDRFGGDVVYFFNDAARGLLQLQGSSLKFIAEIPESELPSRRTLVVGIPGNSSATDFHDSHGSNLFFSFSLSMNRSCSTCSTFQPGVILSAVFTLACERKDGVEGPLASPKMQRPRISIDGSTLYFPFALSVKSVAASEGIILRTCVSTAIPPVFSFGLPLAARKGPLGKLVLPALQSGN